MKTNKDLAYNYAELASPMKMSDMKANQYPNVRFEGKESLDLPKEGTMTVKFRVIREEESTVDGNERYCCTVELLKITDVSGGAVTAKKRDAGDALDAIMEMVKTAHSDEGGY